MVFIFFIPASPLKVALTPITLSATVSCDNTETSLQNNSRNKHGRVKKNELFVSAIKYMCHCWIVNILRNFWGRRTVMTFLIEVEEFRGYNYNYFLSSCFVQMISKNSKKHWFPKTSSKLYKSCMLLRYQ